MKEFALMGKVEHEYLTSRTWKNELVLPRMNMRLRKAVVLYQFNDNAKLFVGQNATLEAGGIRPNSNGEPRRTTISLDRQGDGPVDMHMCFCDYNANYDSGRKNEWKRSNTGRIDVYSEKALEHPKIRRIFDEAVSDLDIAIKMLDTIECSI